MDTERVRAEVASPTYLAGLHDPRGTAILDPARLAWGLAAACERLGVRIHENTPATALERTTSGVAVQTAHGRVSARRVLLATSCFPPLLRRMAAYVVPVWDYSLMTEPLPRDVRESLGWRGRQGIGDAGNRLPLQPADLPTTGCCSVVTTRSTSSAATSTSAGRSIRRPSPCWRSIWSRRFRSSPRRWISHAWGGAIDTCSRFSAFWGQAMGGRVGYVIGFTGLGVGASHFGARTALDLLDGRDTERTRLQMVRSKPIPFPPEPLRWTGIQLTRVRSPAPTIARDGGASGCGRWIGLVSASTVETFIHRLES